MDDRFATLFECFLNFPRASYLERRRMHGGGMSRCYINITRNTFIVKTSLICNGPAVRIKGNKPRGRYD